MRGKGTAAWIVGCALGTVIAVVIVGLLAR